MYISPVPEWIHKSDDKGHGFKVDIPVNVVGEESVDVNEIFPNIISLLSCVRTNNRPDQVAFMQRYSLTGHLNILRIVTGLSTCLFAACLFTSVDPNSDMHFPGSGGGRLSETVNFLTHDVFFGAARTFVACASGNVIDIDASENVTVINDVRW